MIIISSTRLTLNVYIYISIFLLVNVVDLPPLSTKHIIVRVEGGLTTIRMDSIS